MFHNLDVSDKLWNPQFLTMYILARSSEIRYIFHTLSQTLCMNEPGDILNANLFARKSSKGMQQIFIIKS